MTHSAGHHIEHAEHAVHAAHDEFNKQVTMSIAIVAAVLACVTMLGHRSHNETLRLQGEALDYQTKASIKSTETANKWAYYQSKNMFSFESEIMLDLLKLVATREASQKDAEEITRRYEETVAYYQGDKDHRVTRRAKPKSSGDHEKKQTDEHEKKHAKEHEKKHVGKLAKDKHEAEELAEKSEELLKIAEEKMHESHVEHQKTARLDYGELGLQFGVVLCSLAILTHSRSFWLGGLISAAIGAAVAMTGQFSLFLGGGH